MDYRFEFYQLDSKFYAKEIGSNNILSADNVEDLQNKISENVKSHQKTINQYYKEAEELPVEETKKDAELSLQEKIFNFFVDNPFPKDEKVHELATTLGIEPNKLEEEIYSLVSTFVAGGLSKGKEVDMDEFDRIEGEKIELEHVSTDSPYATLIARKIRNDHVVEHPAGYYKGLAKLEEELKNPEAK
jgi:hypothetical protein